MTASDRVDDHTTISRKRKTAPIILLTRIVSAAAVIILLIPINSYARENITEEDENPYSKETAAGFFLYDIFEANRGGYTGKDLSEEDSFVYHKIFNPLQDDHYYMEWDIRLLKWKGSAAVINEVNRYHSLLFEREKERMKKLYEEGVSQYEDGMNPDFNYYSRNLRTEAYYDWNNFFTVVDIADVHMSQKGGCSLITANFNKLSAKQYELDDLFIVKDYKERLLKKIALQYQEESYMVNDWEYCFNENQMSFLLTVKGLMLIDNLEQRTFLIEWGELEELLRKEIAYQIKNCRI